MKSFNFNINSCITIVRTDKLFLFLKFQIELTYLKCKIIISFTISSYTSGFSFCV